MEVSKHLCRKVLSLDFMRFLVTYFKSIVIASDVIMEFLWND